MPPLPWPCGESPRERPGPCPASRLGLGLHDAALVGASRVEGRVAHNYDCEALREHSCTHHALRQFRVSLAERTDPQAKNHGSGQSACKKLILILVLGHLESFCPAPRLQRTNWHHGLLLALLPKRGPLDEGRPRRVVCQCRRLHFELRFWHVNKGRKWLFISPTSPPPRVAPFSLFSRLCVV